MRREFGVGLGVRQIVRHVGKKRASWLQTLREGERLFQGGVAGMGRPPQRIEDDDVKVMKQRELLARYIAHIGEVSSIAKTEARDLNFSVGERDR